MAEPNPQYQKAILHLVFYGDLLDFFSAASGDRHIICYPLTRRASIKDIIEALGVPHTEISRIHAADQDLTFSMIPGDGERYDIEPLSPRYPVTVSTILRPDPLNDIRFLVDATTGKLAKLLRMAGVDTAAAPRHQPISEIARCAVSTRRILLTRHKALLQLREVSFGRLVRNQDPIRQFEEVQHLYNLAPLYRPFSRCMICNGLLQRVDKAAIISHLEPLTHRYYHHFKQCTDCGRIYWRGSHYERMKRIFNL